MTASKTNEPNIGSITADRSITRARPGRYKNRLHHAVGRSHENSVAYCKQFFEMYVARLPRPIPQCITNWRNIEPLIRHDLKPAFYLVSSIFIARGLNPYQITNGIIDETLAECEYCVRSEEPATQRPIERWLRPVFIQFVNSLRIAACNNNASILPTILPLRSHHDLFRRSITSLPAHVNILLEPCLLKLRYCMHTEHTVKRYYSTLQIYSSLIINEGFDIRSLDDLLSVRALEIHISYWSKKCIRPETRLNTLYVLRWLATDFLNDLDARQRIDSLVRSERSHPNFSDNRIDAIKLFKYARDDAYRNLFNSLHELVKTGGPGKQSRTRISVSSGALLCLISMLSLTRPADLATLVFHSNNIDELVRVSLKQKIDIQDSSLIRTLNNFNIPNAINSFYNFFHCLYGHTPNSLLDGLSYERAWQSSIPRRMRHALEIVAPDLASGDIREVTIAHMIFKNIPVPTIARAAGSVSLIGFSRRYRPLFEVIEASNQSF